MWIKRGWFVGLAVGAGVACGGDGGAGPSPQSLVGTWGATKAELVMVSNPSTKVDLVAMGGTVQLVLTTANTFTLTVSMPGEPLEQSGGTWSSGDVLTLTYTSGRSGNQQFDISLSGNTLTLTGADTDYDFDDDGVYEAAKVNLALLRQP